MQCGSAYAHEVRSTMSCTWTCSVPTSNLLGGHQCVSQGLPVTMPAVCVPWPGGHRARPGVCALRGHAVGGDQHA